MELTYDELDMLESAMGRQLEWFEIQIEAAEKAEDELLMNTLIEGYENAIKLVRSINAKLGTN